MVQIVDTILPFRAWVAYSFAMSNPRGPLPLLMALGLLSFCAGCDESESETTEPSTADPGTEPATAEPAVAEPSEPLSTEAAAELMREHVAKAREVRQALIGDDLDSARAAMAWLADNESSGGELPSSLRPHLESLRATAASFPEATTLTEASLTFAAMLLHLSDCQAAIDGAPEFETPAPPQGEGVTAQMQRHHWAVDRMWEGIVAKDAGRYLSGAEILEDVVLHGDDMPQGILEPERIDAIVDHVHELGASARAAGSWEDRTESFGRLLATCSTCHRAMGVGAFARAALEAND